MLTSLIVAVTGWNRFWRENYRRKARTVETESLVDDVLLPYVRVPDARLPPNSAPSSVRLRLHRTVSAKNVATSCLERQECAPKKPRQQEVRTERWQTGSQSP